MRCWYKIWPESTTFKNDPTSDRINTWICSRIEERNLSRKLVKRSNRGSCEFHISVLVIHRRVFQWGVQIIQISCQTLQITWSFVVIHELGKPRFTSNPAIFHQFCIYKMVVPQNLFVELIRRARDKRRRKKSKPIARLRNDRNAVNVEFGRNTDLLLYNLP